MSKTTCRVFEPTLEEFCDFLGYIRKLESLGVHNDGICKVIPPGGWFERDYDISGVLGDMMVTKPIVQLLSGRQGAFTINIEEKPDISVRDFYRYCQKNDCKFNSWEERERQFWRSLGLNCGNQDPFYGSDVLGSLFPEDDEACGWNINMLDTPIKNISHVPGVTGSMLYFGSWRAMFGFHTEDFDLHSINYNHTGAEKSWYCIPPPKRLLFESTAAAYFPSEHQNCREYLRHKTHILSPSRLKEGGLQYTTAVQKAGEFIITFPGAYHAGFNHGFNIAEATNIVTEKWLNVGLKAKMCKCRPGLVNIDVFALETFILRDKKRNELLQASEVASSSTNPAGATSCDTTAQSDDDNICRKSSNGFELELLRCLCDRSQFKRSDILSPVESRRCEKSQFGFPCSLEVSGIVNSVKSPSNKIVTMKTYSDAIHSKAMFQCCECNCWCHTACVFHSLPHCPPDNATCHVCQEINRRQSPPKCNIDEANCNTEMPTLVISEVGKAHSGNHTQSDPDPPHEAYSGDRAGNICVDGSIIKRHSHLHEKRALQSEDNVSLTAYDNAGKALGVRTPPPPSKKRRTESGVTLGDRVTASVTRIDCFSSAVETIQVEGLVKDISEGHFRLHIKGTRKDNDHWINISDLESYSLMHTGWDETTCMSSSASAQKKYYSSKRVESLNKTSNIPRMRHRSNAGKETESDDLFVINNNMESSSYDCMNCDISCVQILPFRKESNCLHLAEKLLSLIEASHKVCSRQGLMETTGQSNIAVAECHATSSLHKEFPLYLSQCKTLFEVCKPYIVMEMTDFCTSRCVNCAEVNRQLREFYSTLQNVFTANSSCQSLSPSHFSMSLEASSSTDCATFLYDGQHYPLPFLLNVISADHHSIVASSKQPISIGCNSVIFFEKLSRLMQLGGTEYSVYGLLVELSKLFQIVKCSTD